MDDEEDMEQPSEEAVPGPSPSSSLHAAAHSQQQEQQPQRRWGLGHRRQAAITSFAQVGESSASGAWLNAEEGMMMAHARAADEPAQAEVADDKATTDSSQVKVAPATTVEVPSRRAKTAPTGGLVGGESAADDKVKDEAPRAVSYVASTSHVDSMPGQVQRIRTATAGGQNFGANAAVVGNRGRGSTVAGQRPFEEAIAPRPLAPPVPRLDPARIVAVSLSEKRRIKAERARGCSQGQSSLPTRLDLVRESGFEDIPHVLPLFANRSPSAVSAGGNTGERFADYPVPSSGAGDTHFTTVGGKHACQASTPSHTSNALQKELGEDDTLSQRDQLLLYGRGTYLLVSYLPRCTTYTSSQPPRPPAPLASASAGASGAERRKRPRDDSSSDDNENGGPIVPKRVRTRGYLRFLV